MDQKLTNSLRLSINSSSPILPHPSPNSGNSTHSTVLIPRNSVLHVSVQAEFSESQGSFQHQRRQGQLCPFPLEGDHTGLFQTHTFGPAQPRLAFGFQSFCHRTREQLQIIDPEGKAEVELKALCMHKNHQATKYFIKFQQLAS